MKRLRSPLGSPSSPARARRASRERGATLLVSIAILTLLAVFSIAFVQLVNFERHASTNYVDAVRARMIARAGLQRAVAELQRIATLKHYSDPVGDRWGFAYQAPAGPADLNMLSTVAPSFATPDTGSRRIFGGPLVYSGALSSTYGPDSLDAYKLKIIDAASQLNLNHPDDASLQRMLKNLFRCAAELDPQWTLTEADANLLAQRIIAVKPPRSGFRSLTEVWQILSQQILPGPSNVVTPQADRWLHPSANGQRPPLRDMLTTSSWVDESVIRPWNLNNEGRRSLPAMPRAPVNLNTASVPVLTAVLAELQGAGRFGRATIDYAAGKALAEAIRARVHVGTGSVLPGTGPFKSWHDFETWLDTNWAPGAAGTLDGFAAGAGGTVVTTAMAQQLPRDLVKAALNPNTMINKFGAHATNGGSVHGRFALPRLIDKSDLIRHGTEGCFDSMGVYDVTSLGMVLVRNERVGGAANEKHMLIVAEQTQQAVIRIYDVLRLTTQADFERHRTLNQAAGDFIPAFDRTWTYTVPGVNRARFFGFAGWPGVTSYPVYSIHREEGDPALAMKNEYEAADWDGHLLLSNLLATRAQPMDFIVCFARGSVHAFKVRAWWEPKDQDPATGVALPGAQPTNGGTPESIALLDSPGEHHPPLLARESNEMNPLDAVHFGTGANTTSPDFFEQGSALTPSGALVHPRRLRGTVPAVLAYDSRNLDLLNGSSIRFWVLPTDDPFVRPEEVLFSWLGSRDGVSRDVGFRVVKRALGGSVRIVLEAINTPINRPLDHPSGANSAVGGLGRPDEIGIDVTPGGLGPQWVPGTWHWVVINFGPAPQGSGMSQSARLQVDKKLSDDVINMSNGGLSNSNYVWGELHGHDNGGPLVEDGNTFIDRNGVVCWTAERYLGDWYHCDQTGSVTTVDRERVFPNAVVWQPGNGTTAGEYVIAPGFPPNPFPDGSFARKLLLGFVNKSTGAPSGLGTHPAEMEPTNAGGMGNSGWTYNFAPADMGPDGVGGTADDYQIDIIARWKEASYAGTCDCCSDCGTHDREMRQYWGRQRTSGARCMLLYKGPHMLNLGAGGLGGVQMAPLQLVCDQCMGCDACRVKGPMYFGGEPAGTANMVSGSLAPPNANTMARAVFDNIIVKNNKERRTDAPNALKFEDRFFETNLAGVSQTLNSLNFGAIYRRALHEANGVRARLGTLSWTSYPTTDQSFDFMSSLYRHTTGNLNDTLSGPVSGEVYPLPADGDPMGYRFAGEVPLRPTETLILSIQYSQLLGSAAQRANATLYPQPMLESPVLEDVTVTLVLDNPLILHAEEGVEE